ncbi:MAG: Trk system potassium transporter TrkA [Bacteroidales bacterium]|nr:Trk system potassium transporter TrkA [Bacteroidales bacterium]MCF8454798.1 Trk system potassium transporter TrkA [Bacteroidales bacterium]
MKIILAGAGAVGTHLAKMLSNENHDIVVIDPDVENLNYINSHFDIMTITGSAASIETLLEAGVRKTDLFVAVTPTQEMNITACILSKKLGAKKTISRIDNPEYLFPHNKKYFIELGVDSLIYPEKLAGDEVINLLNQTGTTEIVNFSQGMLSLYVIKLDENAPVLNKTLLEASKTGMGFNYRAVAISRKGQTIIPRGHDVFMVNDLVHVITNQSGIPTLMEYSGKEKYAIKNLMILGGSRIGKRVAKKLQGQFNIKLIEIDRDRSFEASDILHNTLVINGDGRNIDLLLEEGIKKMDAFIAVTENSETNILSCLAAKQFGVKKTIAEIENIDYIDLAENIGIDTIINKKLVAASHIYAFTMSADVQSIKCLTGTDADVVELIVKPGSKVTKHLVKDLNFPQGALIGGVVRDNEAFIVQGSTQIIANDTVVIFAVPAAIHKVEKFFT